MAHEALVDFGIFFASNLLRYHPEVFHVVTRGSLMTLGAVHGIRRRMLELWDRPFRRRVALPTILAQELEVPILVGMAGRAIQDRLLRGEARMAFRPVARGLVLADPGEEIFPHQFVFTV